MLHWCSKIKGRYSDSSRNWGRITKNSHGILLTRKKYWQQWKGMSVRKGVVGMVDAVFFTTGEAPACRVLMKKVLINKESWWRSREPVRVTTLSLKQKLTLDGEKQTNNEIEKCCVLVLTFTDSMHSSRIF